MRAIGEAVTSCRVAPNAADHATMSWPSDVAAEATSVVAPLVVCAVVGDDDGTKTSSEVATSIVPQGHNYHCSRYYHDCACDLTVAATNAVAALSLRRVSAATAHHGDFGHGDDD